MFVCIDSVGIGIIDTGGLCVYISEFGCVFLGNREKLKFKFNLIFARDLFWRVKILGENV